MGLKSSYSRLVRLYKESRDRWRAKAIERRKANRLLELRIRDLEISRAKWKEKALAVADAEKPPIEKTETDDGNEEKHRGRSLTDVALFTPPINHHYPVSTIQIAIQNQVEGLASLRGTEKIFEWFSPFLPKPMQEAPDHATVQSWTQRLGLFLLNQPVPRRDDWVFVMDHFLERGVTKCLVILGIAHSELAKSSYSPSHKSMLVLTLEVVEYSTGEKIQASLERLSERVGEPVQIVSDHGPDLRKGIGLFCERHPKTIHTYDISHRLAGLLKAEVETDPFWKGFQEQCNQLRSRLQQTEWDFLMPPAKRSKGRFMEMARVEWVLNLLAYAERGDFSQLPPAYSINWECRRLIERQFGPEAHHAVLCRGSGDRFTDPEELRREIVELIGTDEPFADGFWELADERRRRFNELFAGLLSEAQAFSTYAQFLTLIKCTQILLKKEGIHADSGTDLAKQFGALKIVDERPCGRCRGSQKDSKEENRSSQFRYLRIGYWQREAIFEKEPASGDW